MQWENSDENKKQEQRKKVARTARRNQWEQLWDATWWQRSKNSIEKKQARTAVKKASEHSDEKKEASTATIKKKRAQCRKTSTINKQRKKTMWRTVKS